jgi:hypothetical protein
MTLTLHLTPETENKLREWAILTGKQPEAVALEALQEKLSDGIVSLPQAASMAEFQTWFAAHPCSQSRALDDSRESIYAERGE